MRKSFSAVLSLISLAAAILCTAAHADSKSSDHDKMEHCKSERARLGIILNETEVDPSRIRTVELPDGRLQITVHHEVLRGLTMDDMDFWFRNMANALPSKLTDCKPYILLDDDHVSIDSTNTLPDGELQVGSRIRFKEELNGDKKEYDTDENFLISVIDDGHLTFVKDEMFGVKFGTSLVTIERTYQAVDGGIQLESVFTAGIASRKNQKLMKRINRVLIGKLFPPDRQTAWKKHTTEELGALQTLVPWLRAHWN